MISVVMPAYNASRFVALAIESILNQTFQEFELLVVDDGSTDNTVELIKHYVELDKRVRLIQNSHGGICHALNTGINEARYSWIARMDADDIALPTRFEKQINAANANPKVVIWGTYVHHINSAGEILSLQQQGPVTEEEFYDLVRNKQIPFVIHPTTLLKKDILLKVGGYDPEFSLAEDYELLSRVAEYGLILAIPEPLLLYRVHSQSASMQKFFSQQLLARCISERYGARIAGKEQLDLNQFIEQEKKQSILSRMQRNIRTFGQFWYRKAGLLFSERQYLQASFYLCMAIASNPSYSIPRVWKQKLSPEARHSLKKQRN